MSHSPAKIRFIFGSFHGRVGAQPDLIQRPSSSGLCVRPRRRSYSHPNKFRHFATDQPTDEATMPRRRQLDREEIDDDHAARGSLVSCRGRSARRLCPLPAFVENSAACDDNGIMLIIDEVQSGMGRTGKMFALDHEALRRIMCSEGLGSGMPIARRPCRYGLAQVHTSAFGGNPALTAALKTH
jgi:4-aminobutyrate aminotransferase-like enzyme